MIKDKEEEKEPLSFALPEGLYAAWCIALTDAHSPRPTSNDMLATLESVLIQKHASARAIALINGHIFDKGAMREIAVLEETQRLLVAMKANFADFPSKVQKVLKREE